MLPELKFFKRFCKEYASTLRTGLRFSYYNLIWFTIHEFFEILKL